MFFCCVIVASDSCELVELVGYPVYFRPISAKSFMKYKVKIKKIFPSAMNLTETAISCKIFFYGKNGNFS